MPSPTHIPFPEIKQFRQVVRAVSEHAQFVGKDADGGAIYDSTKLRPKLLFEGTVKLHGTNGAICHDKESGLTWFQSREQVIEPGNDNAGFCAHFKNFDLDVLFAKLPEHKVAAIFGEWCGQGINGGTAIAQLPKMFVVFAVKLDEVWLNCAGVELVHHEDMRVFNVFLFPAFSVIIDFEHPELTQNLLGDKTVSVEAECPIAKAFGVSGVGEGIVWRCVEPDWDSSRFWFKVKGEKHSATKVKTLAAVDVEKVKTTNEFVGKVVTESRLRQGIEKLREAGKPLDVTSMGDFLRWIFNDIAKEESDTAEASGIELKKIGGPISLAAKRWFLANESGF